MNAKGRWPLSESGMPTTQHSAMRGEEEMACSIVPVFVSFLLSLNFHLSYRLPSPANETTTRTTYQY